MDGPGFQVPTFILQRAYLEALPLCDRDQPGPKQGKKHVVLSAPHPGDELDDNPPWGHAADLPALIMADSVTGLVDATLKPAKAITGITCATTITEVHVPN